MQGKWNQAMKDNELPLLKLIEDADAFASAVLRTPEKPKRKKKKFAGDAFDPELDEVRLTGLQLDIFRLMSDGEWRTFSEIKSIINRGSENGIAAMLRSLRSREHGAHLVEKRRRGDPKQGLWEYKLVPNERSIRPHA